MFFAGCFVTPAKLTSELNDFDQYLKKQEKRSKAELDLRLQSLEGKVDELVKALQAAQVTLERVKGDILNIQEQTGIALDSTNKMKVLQEKVQKALDEIYAIEGRLKRNFKAMDDRVGNTLEKYHEVLLEEKRILMERLRKINETLRTLSPPSEEEEKREK
jgi:predicted  nucleic acid-binding Zn-ribbon protein